MINTKGYQRNNQVRAKLGNSIKEDSVKKWRTGFLIYSKYRFTTIKGGAERALCQTCMNGREPRRQAVRSRRSETSKCSEETSVVREERNGSLQQAER